MAFLLCPFCPLNFWLSHGICPWGFCFGAESLRLLSAGVPYSNPQGHYPHVRQASGRLPEAVDSVLVGKPQGLSLRLDREQLKPWGLLSPQGTGLQGYVGTSAVPLGSLHIRLSVIVAVQ
ncbi:hypothetical protein PPACK8108_LOCUS4983 [Phakopsora pachyrhizi]|uniref:Uncharacterized protein n=1 Tax=Phakopsora pachyrhizi TaxID=170000 RepID=A0AAV0AQR3_PHAPC|nr:hypothetical protein PPACK8108_LOCUS4983 [Phakopsora pachyrhizi]